MAAEAKSAAYIVDGVVTQEVEIGRLKGNFN